MIMHYKVNSGKYSLFGVYLSLRQRNTVYKYKLQKKPIIKEIQIDTHFHFSLLNSCRVNKIP